MALPLKSGADLYTQELLRARLHNFDGDLAEYGTGSIYFNTTSGLNTSDRIRYRGLTNWHSVANLEDIARLEEMIGNLDFAGSEDFIGITSRVAALEGNFTNGAAKDAVKFGGQLPSYYATQSAFSALQEKVNAFLDGDVDSDAVLENLKEIQAFLDSYDGATSLVDLLDAKADKSQLSGYLPLSGGTLSGLLIIDRYDALIQYKRNGASVGYMGIDSELKPIVYSADGQNNHYLLHSGNIRDYAFSPQTQIINNTDADTLLTNGVYLNATGNGSGNSNFPSEYSILMTFTQEKKYSAQISVGTGSMHVRRKIDAWSDWKTIAFTDSNVASATKLATQRSFWGNLFDGTGDVTGGIAFNGIQKISWHSNADSYYIRSSVFTGATNPSLEFCAWGGHYFSSRGVTRLIINQEGNVTIGDADHASSKYKFFAHGKGRVSGALSCIGLCDSRPILGSAPLSGFTIDAYGENTYGLSVWLESSGQSFIQSGRFDGSATAYALNLQPLGGDVNVGANLKVGGKMAVGSSVLDAYYLYVAGETRVDGALWTYGHIRPMANGAYYLGLIDNAWAGAAFTGNVVLGSGTEGIYINGSSLNWHTDRNAWSATLASFSKTMLTSHVLAFLDAGALIPTGQTLKIGDATLSWDSTSNALKVDKDFYSDGQVSSGGVAEEGTGGAVGGSGLARVVFTIPENTTTFDCVHNLGTREISVAIYEEGNDYQQILTDVYLDSTNIARIVFGRATDVAHKVVIIG